MKKYILLVLTAIIIGIYVYLQSNLYVKSGDGIGESPVISFSSEELVISVNADESALFQGVLAYDAEDGTITDQIIIEELSTFLGNHTRSIRYVVFDSDDNVTKNSRLVTYKDYTPPIFVMDDELRDEYYSVADVTKVLHAYSCVDGDISNNITIMNTSFISNNQLQLKISVSDSTNTTSYLTVNYYLDDDYDIDIVLDDYLIYLKAGETYNFRNNIINIVEKITENMGLVNSVQIDVPDLSKPGIYEVTYSLNRKNGNHGKCVMVVVVE